MSKILNDDLWPSDLTKTEFLSPLTILARQRDLIAEKTESHILGEIRPIDSGGKFIRSYGFMMIAPGLENYRFPILKIDYPLNSIFPIAIESRQIVDETIGNEEQHPYKEWTINTAEELKEVIGAILAHPTTVNAVRALLAESKARGYDPNGDDTPF